MDTTAKGLVVVLIAFVLLGVYAWFERERTLECRVGAVERGVPSLEAIEFCER